MRTRKKPRSDTDFSEFGRWYSERRRRAAGRPASPNTVRTKLGHLKLCARLTGCADPGALGILLQDRERVNTLLDVLGARMTPGAMRSYVYSLLAFAEWAKAAGVSEHSTLAKADVPAPNPPPAITVYSREELETFIAAARGTGVRWWAFLAFLADTGRRVGEVLGLRWEYFRLHDNPAYVELPTTKNGRPQYVPLTKRMRDDVLTDENIARLVGEVRQGRRQFNRSAAEHPFPWTYASVYKRFQWFCATAGFTNRGLHNFRHSVITERLAAGVPLHAVSALAGHSSVAVTQQRYDHTTALTHSRYVERDWKERR